MRISADKDDPGYLTKKERRTYSIMLDGELQYDVITADEDLGLVIRLARNERGVPVIEDGKLMRVELHGAVRVFKRT